MTFATETASISRTPVDVIEFTLDYCSLAYGVGACTATGTSGNECYNTYSTCHDKPNFAKTTKTYKFCSADVVPPYDGLRPYIEKTTDLPTEIKDSITVKRRKKITFIDVTDTDVGVDPYIANRASVAQGTWFKRLVARNSNFQGRTAVQKVGYSGMAEADFQTRFQGTINNITFGKGTVTFELVDFFNDFSKVSIPASYEIKLNSATDASQTTIGLKSIPTGLPSTGTNYIRFNDEIVSYTGVNTTTIQLTGCTRGVFSTTAAAHNENDKGTFVEYFAPANPYVHLKTIAVTKVGVAEANWHQTDVDYVAESQTPGGAGNLTLTSSPVTIAPGRKVIIESDGDESGITFTVTGKDLAGNAQVSAAFTGPNATSVRATDSDGVELYWSEVSQIAVSAAGTGNITAGIVDGFQFWQEYPVEDIDYTAIIVEPVKADKLFFELAGLLNLAVWQDENQQITCRRLLTNDPSKLTSSVSDSDNIILSSGKADLNTDSRITRVILYWDRETLEDGDQPKDFNGIQVTVDTDAESANEYNDQREEVLYSRWFRRDVLADDGALEEYIESLTLRRLRQRRDATPVIDASLELKDEGKKTGDTVTLTTDEIVGITGAPLAAENYFITKREPKGDNVINYRFKKLPIQKSFIIAPENFGDPDYVAADQVMGGSGNMTLTASPVTISPARKLSITAILTDESGVTFTVTGKDEDGGAQVSAATTGPNSDDVVIVDGSSNELMWSEVSQIAVSGATNGYVSAGIFIDYEGATTAEKEYGIISDANGKLDLNTEGYRIY